MTSTKAVFTLFEQRTGITQPDFTDYSNSPLLDLCSWLPMQFSLSRWKVLARQKCFVSVIFFLSSLLVRKNPSTDEKRRRIGDWRHRSGNSHESVRLSARRLATSVCTRHLIGQIRASPNYIVLPSIPCFFAVQTESGGRRCFLKTPFFEHHHIRRRWICRKYSLLCFLQSPPEWFLFSPGDIQFSLWRKSSSTKPEEVGKRRSSVLGRHIGAHPLSLFWFPASIVRPILYFLYLPFLICLRFKKIFAPFERFEV